MSVGMKPSTLGVVCCRDCDAKVGVVWFGGEIRFVDPKMVETPHGKAILLHVCKIKNREPGEDDDK